MTRPARLSVLAALLVVLATVVGVSARHVVAKAPVTPEAAGLTGQVWVLPGTEIPAFLKEHCAPAASSLPDGESVVVGRVTWSGREGATEDRFTILLGDERAAQASSTRC